MYQAQYCITRPIILGGAGGAQIWLDQLTKEGKLCPLNNTGTPRFLDLSEGLITSALGTFFCVTDVKIKNLQQFWEKNLNKKVKSYFLMYKSFFAKKYYIVSSDEFEPEFSNSSEPEL